MRDNGTGIPDEVKAKIFNPFFTTKPAGEGTGLGLSMTHDIVVKQHGGALDVDSSPGAYTEFTLTLPRGGAIGVEGIEAGAVTRISAPPASAQPVWSKAGWARAASAGPGSSGRLGDLGRSGSKRDGSKRNGSKRTPGGRWVWAHGS